MHRQHYILDVTFTEEAGRIRKRTVTKFLLHFLRLALSLLQRDITKKIRFGVSVSVTDEITVL